MQTPADAATERAEQAEERVQQEVEVRQKMEAENQCLREELERLKAR